MGLEESKRTIRGVTIWTTRNDEELQTAAEEWSERHNLDDEDLQQIWDKHPPEVRSSYIRGAERMCPFERPKKLEDETSASFHERVRKEEGLWKVYVMDRALSLFAQKLLPTVEERVTGMLNDPGSLSAESRERLDKIEEREKEAQEREDRAREASERQYRNEFYDAGGSGPVVGD